MSPIILKDFDQKSRLMLKWKTVDGKNNNKYRVSLFSLENELTAHLKEVNRVQNQNDDQKTG